MRGNNRIFLIIMTLIISSIQSHAQNGSLLSRKANSLLKQKNYDSVIFFTTKFIHQNPHNSEAYAFRAYARSLTIFPDSSLADANKAIQTIQASFRTFYIDGRLFDPYLVRAFVYNKRGAFTAALSDISKSISKNKQNSYAYMLQGIADEERDTTLSVALQDYRRAYALNPKEAEALFKIGRILSIKNKRDSAMILFSDAIKADTSENEANSIRIQSFAYLGHSLWMLGRYQEAIAPLELALQYDSSLSYARYFLADSYYYTSNTQKAIGLFKECCKDDPMDACEAAAFLTNYSKGNCLDVSFKDLIKFSKGDYSSTHYWLVFSDNFIEERSDDTTYSFFKCIDSIHFPGISSNLKMVLINRKGKRKLSYVTTNSSFVTNCYNEIRSSYSCDQMRLNRSLQGINDELYRLIKNRKTGDTYFDLKQDFQNESRRTDEFNLSVSKYEVYCCETGCYEFGKFELTPGEGLAKRTLFMITISPP